MLGMSKGKNFLSIMVLVLGTLSIILNAGAVYNTPLLQSPATGTVISDTSVTCKWFFVSDTNY
jgi:hypothetical protein